MPRSSWTIEDLYDICQKVSKDINNDGMVDQFGIADYTWENAVFAYGAELFGNDGSSANFTSSKVRKALTMIEKLNVLSGNYKPGSDDFDKGKVAFLPMTLAQYRTYESYPYHVAKYSAFSWTCIKMPSESKKFAEPTLKRLFLQFLRKVTVRNWLGNLSNCFAATKRFSSICLSILKDRLFCAASSQADRRNVSWKRTALRIML